MLNLKYKINSDFDLVLKSSIENIFYTKTPFVNMEYGRFSSKKLYTFLL